MIGTRFLTFGNDGEDVAHDSDIFNKTELLSPQKQYLYLAGLLMSTSEPSADEKMCSEEDFQELENSVQEVTFEYVKNFTNIDFTVSPPDPEQIQKNFVSFEAFTSYFDTGILRYEEQTEDLIKNLYLPFDAELKTLTTLSVDDYLDFYHYISSAYGNSFEQGQKVVMDVAAFLDSLDPDTDNPEAEYKRMMDFASGSMRNKFQAAIDGLNTVKITDIITQFGEEKGNALIDLFSIKREERNFIYYNGKNPFTKQPLCRIDDCIFIVHPQFVLNAIFEYMTLTLENPKNSFAEKYKKAKADIVENLFIELLKNIFGSDATYRSSVCEERGTKEHDILVEYENYLIIAEVKASKVREPFFNPDKAFTRIRDHFHSDSGIGGAYKQAIILKNKLEENDTITLYENQTNAFTISDISKKTILPFVFTLNQFGGLAINTSQIIEKEPSDPYPWVCNLHDLENIIQINRYLNKSTAEFLAYIEWRIRHHEQLFASDELDIIEEYYLDQSMQKLDYEKNVVFQANGPSLIDKIYFESKGIPYTHPVMDKTPRRSTKPGVNDPCPCGSGKKFKKCCRKKGIYD